VDRVTGLRFLVAGRGAYRRLPALDKVVILCRKGKAEEALQRLREIMGKLKLTVNEEKTIDARARRPPGEPRGCFWGRMALKAHRSAGDGAAFEIIEDDLGQAPYRTACR
jgi:hypothetical protein